ncbi:hypothetical protein HZ326_31905 [Fusarium oxysporum f. sp. albedinis]|nr:hypothetical protein HZ326_31905 [Fusarium oxysporum f. sp. albedinis]
MYGLSSIWVAFHIPYSIRRRMEYGVWIESLVKGTCGNQVSSFIAIGAFNAITDVLILSLPLPVLWSLQARTSTKVGLTIIFSIGLLYTSNKIDSIFSLPNRVSVVAIIRIISLASVDLKGNLTGTMVWAAFLSTVEPNLARVGTTTSTPLWGQVEWMYDF